MFNKKMSKHGQIGISAVPGLVLTVVLAVVMGAVGIITVTAFKSGQSSTVNATLDQGVTSIGNIFDLFPTVGTIVAVVVIIGLLLAGFAGFLYMKGNNGGGF